MPGPIFTFAAFLGAVETPSPNGWIGAIVATAAIFASSFLLVGGLLPFWDRLRHRTGVQAAMRGVNAAVVGVLLAALYDPIWTGTVHGTVDFGFVLVAFLLLTLWSRAAMDDCAGRRRSGRFARVLRAVGLTTCVRFHCAYR